MPDEQPRFEHDCDACVFLGRQEDMDVYYCSQRVGGERIPTVVFRWGDAGPDYDSGWSLRDQLRPDLQRALKDVQARA